VLLLSVWIAAWVQTESWQQGLYFVGGVVGTGLLLALVALGILRLVQYLPKDAGGLHLRHGLARLGRPGAGTMAAIISLGLGVAFVFAIWTVQDHLGEQLLAEAPADAPNAFFLDVQTDQWPALAEQLKAEGATGIDSQPIVTARFTAIDGESVTELAKRNPRRGDEAASGSRGGQPRRGGWRLTREQRITYGSSLPRGNQVTSGAFPSGQSNGVSVEESFARRLGIDVGSQLTLDVQGVPVDLVVTSLRTIDWRTFGINFFLFAEAGGPLDEAPQQRVAVARLPDASVSALQGRIVSRFPNVTVIPIKDVMEKVLAVLDKLGMAVRALGLFIVLAGSIVLGGAIAASQVRRAREVALVKTLGMTRGDVLAIFSIEYALIGTVAGLVGVAAGLGIAYAIVVHSMELPWTVNLWHMLFAVFATAILAVVAGISASTKALSARPVEVLRTS
jgi:putative ABC transport system permease protein